jgi:hypothetical protein
VLVRKLDEIIGTHRADDLAVLLAGPGGLGGNVTPDAGQGREAASGRAGVLGAGACPARGSWLVLVAAELVQQAGDVLDGAGPADRGGGCQAGLEHLAGLPALVGGDQELAECAAGGGVPVGPLQAAEDLERLGQPGECCPALDEPALLSWLLKVVLDADAARPAVADLCHAGLQRHANGPHLTVRTLASRLLGDRAAPPPLASPPQSSPRDGHIVAARRS